MIVAVNFLYPLLVFYGFQTLIFEVIRILLTLIAAGKFIFPLRSTTSVRLLACACAALFAENPSSEKPSSYVLIAWHFRN
ncbi:hypothetical protein BS17DRAFT_760036, partial [Gyrodon lividus]